MHRELLLIVGPRGVELRLWAVDGRPVGCLRRTAVSPPATLAHSLAMAGPLGARRLAFSHARMSENSTTLSSTRAVSSSSPSSSALGFSLRYSFMKVAYLTFLFTCDTQ